MSKLADIEITKLKEMAKSGTYDTWGNAWVFEMLDTIEALQQENEQLKSENASLRNWNACEEKLHNELLESDRRRIELESELEAEKDYRAGLEAIINKLQAQAARMREALDEAICCIESGRLCSIGSICNTYSSQISVSSVERWKKALAEIEAIGGKEDV